jgi:hypothetical protein
MEKNIENILLTIAEQQEVLHPQDALTKLIDTVANMYVDDDELCEDELEKIAAAGNPYQSDPYIHDKK